MNYLGQLIPAFIVMVVLGVVFLFIAVYKKIVQAKKRRSPFTANFLRGPGESLRANLDKVNADILENAVSVMILPLGLYAMLISQYYFGEVAPGLLGTIFIVCFGIVVELILFLRLIKGLNLRRKLRLGYEGEVAAGQELNQLMRDGFYVFHDFQADGFNIDHIVVGPAGVFAVETKARSKPTSGDRVSDAEVIYDGRKLQFPNRIETKPLRQARNQALWLSRWLRSAAGEDVKARPVVTLPGWFVRRVSSKGFPVINPKQFRSIAKPINGKILNEGQIQRIVHQIDQKCRDVEPQANKGLAGAAAVEAAIKA